MLRRNIPSTNEARTWCCASLELGWWKRILGYVVPADAHRVEFRFVLDDISELMKQQELKYQECDSTLASLLVSGGFPSCCSCAEL